jgi:hypothetical protein
LHCLVFKEQLDFSSAALLKRLVYYILSLSGCQALFEFLFSIFLSANQGFKIEEVQAFVLGALCQRLVL